MAEIELKDVSVIYSNKRTDTVALNNFSATFRDGMNVIVGYSGCGKTTLLNCILGLVNYDGKIFFDGTDLADVRIKDRNFSFVSQEYVLFPHNTVFDNIAFPLKVMGASRQEIIERVKQVAEMTDIAHCLSRSPKHISGGQQQRTAVARALVKRPSVCLMDEAFSNTDELARAKMCVWVKNLLKKEGCMAIYVTHNFREALSLADTLYVMDEGQLSICGTPEEVYKSDNEVVRNLKEGLFF